MFDSHGDYKLTLSGQIVIIDFLYSWNMEAATLFFSEYKAFLKENQLTEFAVLSDMSRFEGCTEDTALFFREISLWAESNGQAARGMISYSGYNSFIVNLMDNINRQFPVKSFNDKESAMQWFQSLGLRIS